MSDAKTYVFGQDSNCMNWLTPLLQQKGIDPSVLAMMNNGGFGNGNWILGFLPYSSVWQKWLWWLW